MAVDRRKFFTIAGLSTLVGLMGKEVLTVAAQSESKYLAAEKVLTAHRWAMTVDLTKCKQGDGCEKECIQACHDTHNVPAIENLKHEVKWIWTEPYEKAFPSQENEFNKEELIHKEVLVFCNHCDNPPCVRVCPTQATWKQEDGIVMMDWHRCIGCRYCIAACPYGSRSFNWVEPAARSEDGQILPDQPFLKKVNSAFPTRTRGVVEKCTFCDARLAKGLQPACVEACKQGALAFGDLDDPNSEIRALLKDRFSIRRKPGLGTQPQIYYLV
ncbi:MAG: 4Fe-4S dicluster domain-containing protein [Candidatus Omnitrophica bacterium]|nr:4Fe-4S dicluster domain-containing protein [Candidatus Omnitrophota bacterium]